MGWIENFQLLDIVAMPYQRWMPRDFTSIIQISLKIFWSIETFIAVQDIFLKSRIQTEWFILNSFKKIQKIIFSKKI